MTRRERRRRGPLGIGIGLARPIAAGGDLNFDDLVLSHDPWAYLKLEDASTALADASGNGNAMTLLGGNGTGVGFATTGPELPGVTDPKALRFQTASSTFNGQIDCGLTHQQFVELGASGVTFGVIRKANPSGDMNTIFGGIGPDTGFLGLSAFVSTTELMSVTHSSASKTATPSAAGAVPNNAWTLLTYTIDAGRNMRGYCDGTLIATCLDVVDPTYNVSTNIYLLGNGAQGCSASSLASRLFIIPGCLSDAEVLELAQAGGFA